MKKVLIYSMLMVFIIFLQASATIINVPGDYATIQAGIDNALDSDTVLVAPNTYYENVIIDHAISLIGISRDNTIIDGNGIGDVVTIGGDGVSVVCFTITHGGSDSADAGIEIGCADSCTVKLCHFQDVFTGVELYGSSFNTISRCRFETNTYGIRFREEIELCEQDNFNNNIVNNVIENAGGSAIYFEHMMYHHDANIIKGNRISNNQDGISMIMSYRNQVTKNELLQNTWYGIFHGVCEGGGGQNEFHHNNFIENAGDTMQAVNIGMGDDMWYSLMDSEGNYWSNYTGPDNNGDGIGDIPMNVEGDNSQDLYPLMEPLESGILGMITNESSIPISDVIVAVIGTEIADTSEYHGGYTLAGLGSGNYDILFSHPAYQDTIVMGVGTEIGSYAYLDMELRLQTDISQADDLKPNAYSLNQNNPNPFNAQTTISYSLPTPTDVKIEIYDLLGRKIETIATGVQPAGQHQIIWDAGNRPSGVYFYKLQADNFAEVKKMSLIK